MNGRDLTLGALAGLAVAGMVAQRRRGSRELTALTAPQGLSPAQPWKGLVGAAKGGPALENWKESLARLPFSLSIEVVGTLKASEAWLAGVRRPGPGKVKMCIYARDRMDPREHSAAAAIQSGRKQAPSDAFALFSPFTVAHRLFDVSYSVLTGKDPNDALVLSRALSEVVMEGGVDEVDVDVLNEWARDDCEDAGAGLDPEEDEDGVNEAMDACMEATFTQWNEIQKVYRDASVLFQSQPLYIDEDAELPDDVAALLERYEERSHLISRVLVSLCCPTAAGRLLRLTDYSQAMADCYATHVVSGRNPLVWLTVRDLERFSVDAQVKRWLATASAKKATEGQIAKYRRELERVAVPVLRFLCAPDDDRSGLLREAVRMAEVLHAQRAGLIHAANGVFAIQRVVVL